MNTNKHGFDLRRAERAGFSNGSFPITPTDKAVREESAFTLVELLVVIGIIALLAALVVSGAGLASAKMRRARVETERNAIETAIDSYHKAKGFYPPDNSVNGVNMDSVQTPLYYELTGTMMVVNNSGTNFISANGQTLPQTAVGTLFGVGGFLNCSNSETPAKNFFGGGLKNSQFQTVNGSGGNQYTLLGVGVDGPNVLPAANAGGFQINPWHYISSNPTNNHDSYDLWMDVKYSGKTNRISNWSKEPQLVNF